MNPDRYQQIKAIYHAALDRAPEVRADYVAQACVEDPGLKDEVESLLAAEYATRGALDSGAFKAALPTLIDTKPTVPFEISPGTRVGVYQLLKEIGRGGMGAVFLAERADDEFKKRVAIKVIKRGMDTDEIVARFRHERQILAALDHPNIARLLDGGTTPEGLPYFVMEYVEGQPLDEYCAQQGLNIRARLELFRTVCAAVHYAHQNLVVHRDLKPSNIIVTAAGVPKLLDFGIAKVLNPALMSETLAPTATWARPMTPAYASPEQVRGQSITTASDVYSLGVILYELLTGVRPYEIKGKDLPEIVKVVCESQPNKPSAVKAVKSERGEKERQRDEKIERAGQAEAAMSFTGSPSTHLSFSPAQLRGDLDNVVLMALRKEPQRRYASVEQFSEDLRRHLAGLPVIARHDTFGYRASKFVARNKFAVIAASLMALLVFGFLVTTLLQSARVTRERDRAERERVKAEKVASFLIDLFKVNDPSEARGNQVTAREILDKGAEKIRTELKDEPETRATLLHTVGQVYYSLGLYERSVALLEEALQLRRVTLGNEHPEVARTLTALVQTIFELNQMERAETLTREALAIRRKAYGNEHPDVAESLNDLALLTKLKGDQVAAEPLYRETIAVQRKLMGNDSTAVATTLHNLAILLMDKKDYAAAEAAQHEALRIRRQAFGNDAPDVAQTLHNLASVLRRKGDYSGAEATLLEVLAVRRKLHPEGHSDTALTLHNLGTLKREQGDHQQAAVYLRECLAMRLKTLPADHAHTGRAYIELGRVLSPQQLYDEAFAALSEGLRIAQKNNDKSYIAHAMDGLGDVKLAQKKYAEAKPLFLKAYELYQSLKDPERANALKNKLEHFYEAWGKPEKVSSLQPPK